MSNQTKTYFFVTMVCLSSVLSCLAVEKDEVTPNQIGSRLRALVVVFNQRLQDQYQQHQRSNYLHSDRVTGNSVCHRYDFTPHGRAGNKMYDGSERCKITSKL